MSDIFEDFKSDILDMIESNDYEIPVDDDDLINTMEEFFLEKYGIDGVSISIDTLGEYCTENGLEMEEDEDSDKQVMTFEFVKVVDPEGIPLIEENGVESLDLSNYEIKDEDLYIIVAVIDKENGEIEFMELDDSEEDSNDNSEDEGDPSDYSPDW